MPTMKGVAFVALLLLEVWVVAGCARDERCGICEMRLPRETRAVVQIDGRRVLACDPRCALTYQAQTHRRVLLVRVTDAATRLEMDPRDAVFVTGSDIAPDSEAVAMRSGQGEAAFRQWHRCVPSILAFRDRAAAEQFRREHGGTLQTLAQLGFAPPQASLAGSAVQ